MTWVRSPIYDSFWILSAPLLGLGMVFFPWPNGLLLMVNFAHTLSPIILAWSHDGYRQVMIDRPRKFIGVPILLAMVAVVVALTTSAFFPEFIPHRLSLENITWEKLGVPLVIWANVYAVWNLYHGGAQNFGVWCLYRGRGYKSGWRKYLILGLAVLVTTMIVHEAPYLFHTRTVILFTLGFISANHWMAAIGLAGHVHGNHIGRSPVWFISLALMMGLGYSLTFLYCMRSGILWLAVISLSLRGAVGIWHFLQDRWIWQMSNPLARATIGKDLFTNFSRETHKSVVYDKVLAL